MPVVPEVLDSRATPISPLVGPPLTVTVTVICSPGEGLSFEDDIEIVAELVTECAEQSEACRFLSPTPPVDERAGEATATMARERTTKAINNLLALEPIPLKVMNWFADEGTTMSPFWFKHRTMRAFGSSIDVTPQHHEGR